MRYDLFRFDLGRDPHAPAHAELSMVTIILVAACAALVAAPTLVALTYGWDHRLAVMLGATLAAALARWGWRKLPVERIADRLALAFAGTLAAALLCTYASDWLDWRPLDIDDALAGLAIGLVLFVSGPLRQALPHAAHLPTTAGLALIALALAPAGWAVLIHGYYGDELPHWVTYRLIEIPAFGASLVLSALGFGFALRRRLYSTAIALGALAGWSLAVIVLDYQASSADAALLGGTVRAGVLIIAAYACATAAQSVRLPRWATEPVGTLLTGPAWRALRPTVQTPTAAGLGAAALGLAPAVWSALVVAFDDFDRSRAEGSALVVLSSLALTLLLAVLAYVLASQRLYRAALLTGALSGAQILWLGFLAGADPLVVVLCIAVASGCPLVATATAWRAHTTAGPARPTILLAALGLAAVVTYMGSVEPLACFFAAAVLGVWWWFYYRRGVAIVAPGSLERIGERQPLLRLALVASLGLTVGAHLLLLQAAVCNQTGAMILAELGKHYLYPVSDSTFARVILADQYLWRDSISVAETRHIKPTVWWLLEKSRHPRDRWSGTYSVSWRASDDARQVTGTGLESRGVPGGSLVSYVEGGSPAQQAGVRRGDVIRAVDGVALDGPEERRWLPFKPLQRAMRLELVSAIGEVREVSVTEAEYRRSAVSVERVIEATGRKVGYVELRRFREGADDDLVAAAERLRRQGIDELVLDLRMNPGGSVETLVHIASAIGGKRLDGKVFMRIVHNERYRERDEDLRFSVPARGALSLSRVFVITSRRSCSASEGLINGLAPHMEVVTIGGTTCGKPVGSYTVEYGDTGFAVITFRAVNARGEGDYYDGLRPTCGAEDDVRRDFGDPEEASFKAALHYIRHGRCPEPSVWL